MKKNIVMLISIMMMFSSFTFAEIDEPSGWAETEIDELKLYDEFRASAFNDYKENITRAEFIYLAVRIYELFNGEDIVPDASISFNDTDDIYALKGATVGITSGIGDGRFGPKELLTREQLAVLMMNTIKLGNLDMLPNDGYKFNDENKVSTWAKDMVYLAKANDIINGVGNDTFNPKGSATIQQVLVITNKIIGNNIGKKWRVEGKTERTIDLVRPEIAEKEESNGYVPVTPESTRDLVKYFDKSSGETLWGFKDKQTGEIVVKAKYVGVYVFENGRAIVMTHNLIRGFNTNTLIDEEGNELIDSTKYLIQREPTYFKIRVIANPNSTASMRVVEGLADASGKILVEPEYDYVGEITPTRILVHMNSTTDEYLGGTAALFDPLGNVIIPMSRGYRLISELNDVTFNLDGYNKYYTSILQSHIDDKIGLLDIDGNELTPVKYRAISPVSVEGIFYVKAEGKYGLLTTEGKEIIPPIYPKLRNVGSGYYVAENTEGKVGIVNSMHDIELPFDYDYIHPYTGTMILVKKNGKYGFVTLSGKSVVPIEYEWATRIDGEIILEDKKSRYKYEDGQLVHQFDLIEKDSVTTDSRISDNLDDSKLLRETLTRYGQVDGEESSRIFLNMSGLNYYENTFGGQRHSNMSISVQDYKVEIPYLYINIGRFTHSTGNVLLSFVDYVYPNNKDMYDAALSIVQAIDSTRVYTHDGTEVYSTGLVNGKEEVVNGVTIFYDLQSSGLVITFTPSN